MNVRPIPPPTMASNHRPPLPYDETTDTDLDHDEEANLTQSNSKQTKRTVDQTRLDNWGTSFSSIGVGARWFTYAFQTISVILLVIILLMLITGVQEVKNHAIFIAPAANTNDDAAVSHYGHQESSANIAPITNLPVQSLPSQLINTQSPTTAPTAPVQPPPTSDTESSFPTPAPVLKACSCSQVQSELSSLITALRQLAPHDRPEDGVDELHEFMRPIERGGTSRHEYPNGRKKGIPFSYSQLNQDTRLFETYPHTFQQRTGTYLEIGGRNGYYLSNTYMYERFLDWSGMIVEINPRWEDLGALSRPGSIWVNGAILAVNGTVEVGYSDGWSVMFDGVTPLGDNTRRNIQQHLATRSQVPTYRLGQLLPKYGLNRIDLFSLDVAGAEYLVLETIDWSVTQFHFLLIQVNTHMDECAKLLNSHGYQYVDTWDQVQLWTLSDYLWLPQTCTQPHCQGLQQRLEYFKTKKQKYLSGTMKYPPPHLTLAS